MAGALELTLSDLEARFGEAYVRDVFADDGSRNPSGREGVALRVARRHADSELLRAWSAEQIQALVREDDAVRAAILDIAMAEGLCGRPAWETGADGSPADKMRKRGLDSLKRLADGQIRSIAETVTNGSGENPHISVGRVTASEFMFAPSIARPTRGGY